MQHIINTDRLLLNDLTLSDTGFILHILNTPGWLQFIGDRKVRDMEAAENYVTKIINDPNVTYWVVRIDEGKTPIGVISLIQRDYLEHQDIGFAFLPEHSKKGYAFEAAAAVLSDINNNPKHSHILATVLKDNISSTRLLEKLGLRFDKEITREEEILLLYSFTTNHGYLDKLTQDFFGIFNNKDGNTPNWDKIHTLCLPQTIIIKKTAQEEEVYNLDTFMAPRRLILSDGTLTTFEEKEISYETKITGNIAQRFSKYTKNGYLNGQAFEGRGNKLFQFVNTGAGWRISAVIWEDEQ